MADHKCPHCKAKLLKHDAVNGPKAGAEHCNTCGCCFIAGELRPDHPICSLQAATEAKASKPAPEPAVVAVVTETEQPEEGTAPDSAPSE